MAKRGLNQSSVDNLFSVGQKAKKTKKNTDLVRKVDINKVEPDKNQPRFNFDEDALEELSASIKQYGVLQPLLVKKIGDRYSIIAGERRWRASKLAGLKEVPIIVNDGSNEEILEISLIENIQREDLNPIEEALAYRRLKDEFKLKQDEIAEKVNKSRSTITNSLRLLKLDEKVIEMISADMISSGHGRTLLALEDRLKQIEVANKIFDERLSVRETEKLIKIINSGKTTEKVKKQGLSLALKNLQDELVKKFGTKVSIKENAKEGGKLVINYYSNEDLIRIINIIDEDR